MVVPWLKPDTPEPVVPPLLGVVLELPEPVELLFPLPVEPEPLLPPVVCPFMLTAAASRNADVNANALIFMFDFFFSLIKEFTEHPSTRGKLARAMEKVY